MFRSALLALSFCFATAMCQGDSFTYVTRPGNLFNAQGDSVAVIPPNFQAGIYRSTFIVNHNGKDTALPFDNCSLDDGDCHDQLVGFNNKGQVLVQVNYGIFGGSFQRPELYSNGTWQLAGLADDDIPTALNNKGQVLGYSYGADGISVEGFLTTNGHAQVIAVKNPVDTFPTSTSDSGTIVGYYVDAAGTSHSFSDVKGP